MKRRPKLADYPKSVQAKMRALGEGAPRLACEATSWKNRLTDGSMQDVMHCMRCDLTWPYDAPESERPLCGIYEPLTDADFALDKAVRKKPVQREKVEVQRPLVVHLRKHLPKGSVVFAIPNMSRSREMTFSAIRDGMLPGFPDIGIITYNFEGALTAFIECKAPDGGGVSEKQRHVHGQLRDLGVPILPACRSVAEAVTWLESLGVVFR